MEMGSENVTLFIEEDFIFVTARLLNVGRGLKSHISRYLRYEEI